MAHVKCRYIETGWDEGGGCSPEEHFFEKDYRRIEFHGDRLCVGGKTIWAYPPPTPEDNPYWQIYPFDEILYLEIDGNIYIDRQE